MSSVIGRLQAALANVTNEVTIAAANLNFDFTLVKYEVPREYEPIGKLLAPFRKEKAENGSAHVTARRLAALFDGVCPPSPELVKAYGTRASEIVQQATEQEPKEHYATIFSQYAGIDATSMWAAATSSKAADGGAVQIHLLACLLASAFEDSHAVSIWSELVERRRTDIATRIHNEEKVHISLAAAAAQGEIPRQQLAEWDASARSWLQTADSVKLSKKERYDNILQMIAIDANNSKDIYENVMGVWKTAITTMNNLVLGIPQEVQDGATVIGLKAWHLYPDTQYFGRENGHVDMSDPLIPKTGILSLGCSGSSGSSRSGVNWSLSLAHLKFYGDAVGVTGSIQSDPSLMTVDEFHLVILGALFRLWSISPSQETEAIRMLEFLTTSNSFKILKKAISLYRLNGITSRRFLNLGRNRPQFRPKERQSDSQTYYKPGPSHPPYFGLFCGDLLIKSIKSPNARLQALFGKCVKYHQLLCENNAVVRYDEDGVMRTLLLKYKTLTLAGKEDTGFLTVEEMPSMTSTYRNSSARKARKAKNASYSVHSDTGNEIKDGQSIVYGGKGYDLYFGAADCAAVYIPTSLKSTLPALAVDGEDFLRAHTENSFEPTSKFWDVMARDAAFVWLRGIQMALCYLHTLPGPLISARVLSVSSDCFPSWIPSLPSPWISVRGRRLSHNSLEKAFSVLAFYLAQCHVDPSDIGGGVSGLSYRDSLYVPTMHLQDPLKSSKDARLGLTRILGNIGRPGLVIFSSVGQPVLAPNSDVMWRIVDEYTFDGKPEDYFKSTSMHLSFTEWESPISMASSQGNLDVPFLRKESVLSIRDRGIWIGDVDINFAMWYRGVHIWPEQQPCNHQENDLGSNTSMRSIRSWGELCEVHTGVSVVQAHGNWLARLAVTAYLARRCQIQENFFQNQETQDAPDRYYDSDDVNPHDRDGISSVRIIILPKKVCWACIKPRADTEFFIY